MTQRHRFVGSAKLIAVLTALSRTLGLAREMVYSHFFGASPLLSAFRVAYQVPNLSRRLFGEGALTASFIPVFVRCREEEGDREAQRLAGGVLTLLAAIMLALLLAAEVGLLITSRFTWNPTLNLTAILLPYMVLICLTAFFAGLLNVLRRFGVPAMTPMILNVCIIVAALLGPRVFELTAEGHLRVIALAILAAGVLQLGAQVWWMRTTGFRLRVNLDWSNPHVRRIITMMAPMIIGMSAVQINSFADTIIALMLVPDGRGPAVLGYAQHLYQLPLGVFGLALATAIFPTLARRAAAREMVSFARAAEDGVRTTLFVAIPAGVGLVLIGTPLVRTLFEHGQFDPADTSRVVWALAFYGMGVWAFSAQHILVRAFYSMEDSRTPVRIAATMVLLNLVLNIALVFPLKEAGVALATTITAVLQIVWLAVALRRRVPELRWAGVTAMAGRVVVAAAFMAVVVCVLRGWSPLGRLWDLGSTLETIVCVVAGTAAYLAGARILRIEELAVVLRRSPVE